MQTTDKNDYILTLKASVVVVVLTLLEDDFSGSSSIARAEFFIEGRTCFFPQSHNCMDINDNKIHSE